MSNLFGEIVVTNFFEKKKRLVLNLSSKFTGEFLKLFLKQKSRLAVILVSSPLEVDINTASGLVRPLAATSKNEFAKP